MHSDHDTTLIALFVAPLVEGISQNSTGKYVSCRFVECIVDVVGPMMRVLSDLFNLRFDERK